MFLIQKYSIIVINRIHETLSFKKFEILCYYFKFSIILIYSIHGTYQFIRSLKLYVIYSKIFYNCYLQNTWNIFILKSLKLYVSYSKIFYDCV